MQNNGLTDKVQNEQQVSLGDSQPVLLAEAFYKDNPIERDEMCCIVDDKDGDITCVWDYNKPQECSFACKGIKKEDCKYWVKKTRRNIYYADDVFAWMASKQSN